MRAEDFGIVVGVGVAAEIGSTSTAHGVDRLETGEIGVRAAARTPHADGEPAAPPPTARSNAEREGASRRAGLQAMSTRGLLEPILSSSRRTDSPSSGETTVELESGEVGGEPTDQPAATSSVLGWAAEAASVSMPIWYSSDRAAGFDGRAKAGPGFAASDAGSSGSFGDLAIGAESSIGGSMMASGPGGDGTGVFATLAESADLPSTSTALAELLDGSVDPDWAAIDRELRWFLSEVRGLAVEAGDWGVGEVWFIGIGAAAGVALARGTFHRRRRFFHRAGRRPIDETAHEGVPVGPWPLGSP
jgi:hypothetical protein